MWACRRAKIADKRSSRMSSREPSTPALKNTLVWPNLYLSSSNCIPARILLVASFPSVNPEAGRAFGAKMEYLCNRSYACELIGEGLSNRLAFAIRTGWLHQVHISHWPDEAILFGWWKLVKSSKFFLFSENLLELIINYMHECYAFQGSHSRMLKYIVILGHNWTGVCTKCSGNELVLISLCASVNNYHNDMCYPVVIVKIRHI